MSLELDQGDITIMEHYPCNEIEKRSLLSSVEIVWVFTREEADLFLAFADAVSVFVSVLQALRRLGQQFKGKGRWSCRCCGCGSEERRNIHNRHNIDACPCLPIIKTAYLPNCERKLLAWYWRFWTAGVLLSCTRLGNLEKNAALYRSDRRRDYKDEQKIVSVLITSKLHQAHHDDCMNIRWGDISKDCQCHWLWQDEWKWRWS